MSYNVQAAFLSEGFFRRPGHLPNIPEGWNNMMKKAARVWRKMWEENKEISEKGRQESSRNVEEETTRSCLNLRLCASRARSSNLRQFF